MRIKKLIIYITLCIVIPSTIIPSCTEKFQPKLDNKYDELLVVDGKITNAPGPYTVTLSTSSEIDNAVFNPLSNATVIISEDNGSSETLVEIEPGVYTTSESGIQGVVGKKYKVSINTPEGKSYESAFEEIKEPVGIDTVKALTETQLLPNQNDISKTGYQFYVSSQTATGGENFYYWELEETYEYNARWVIYYVFFKDDDRSSIVDRVSFDDYFLTHPHNVIVPENPFLHTCWKTIPVKERFTYRTTNLSEQTIRDLPLHFIPFEDIKLSKKYSLLVKQLSISQNAFAFFNSIEDQTSEEDLLYTKQPYQIRGNIFNTEDIDEPVLGYFLTAGSSEKRIFVNGEYTYIVTGCETIKENFFNTLRNTNITDMLFITMLDGLVYIPGELLPRFGIPAFVTNICSDCRLRGGDTIKPAYWQDIL